MKTRQPTPQEVTESRDVQYALRHRKGKMRFRHFMRELYMPHARNGVQHVQYGMGKLTVVDGVTHVTYMGRTDELTASVAIWGDPERETFFDYRIKSEHLRSLG